MTRPPPDPPTPITPQQHPHSTPTHNEHPTPTKKKRPNAVWPNSVKQFFGREEKVSQVSHESLSQYPLPAFQLNQFRKRRGDLHPSGTKKHRKPAQTATRRRTQRMWWPTCASTGAPTSRRRETAFLRGPPELWRTRASGQFGQLPRSIILLSRRQARPVCIGLTLQSRGTLTPCRVLPGSRLLRLRRPPEGVLPHCWSMRCVK